MANRIADLRKEKGETQTDLAKVLGVSRQAISLYEKGEREPNFDVWADLSKHFDVDVTYLAGFSDQRHPTIASTDEINNFWDDVTLNYLHSDDPNHDLVQQWIRTATTIYEDASLIDTSNTTSDFKYKEAYNQLFNAVAMVNIGTFTGDESKLDESIKVFSDTVMAIKEASKTHLVGGNIRNDNAQTDNDK